MSDSDSTSDGEGVADIQSHNSDEDNERKDKNDENNSNSSYPLIIQKFLHFQKHLSSKGAIYLFILGIIIDLCYSIIFLSILICVIIFVFDNLKCETTGCVVSYVFTFLGFGLALFCWFCGCFCGSGCIFLSVRVKLLMDREKRNNSSDDKEGSKNDADFVDNY